jgi:hypothetical protein
MKSGPVRFGQVMRQGIRAHGIRQNTGSDGPGHQGGNVVIVDDKTAHGLSRFLKMPATSAGPEILG